MEQLILEQINQLSGTFGKTWVALPLFGFSIFIASMFGSPIIYNFMSKKTLNSKTEIERLLELMDVEMDKKKLMLTLLLLSYGLGFIVFLTFWPNVQIGFLAGVAAVFAGMKLPVLYMNAQYEKRCSRIVEQMVDGMTIMANSVKAGLGVTQGMERVAQNLKGPLSQEFNNAMGRIRLGMTVEDSLNVFATRVPRQDVQMLVTAINILKETGGNLGETFETINLVIRERQKLEKKIEAMTTQGKVQGIIISMMPFFLLGLFKTMDPKFVEPLFTTTMGMILLLGVVVLVVLGGIVIKKIVTIKV